MYFFYLIFFFEELKLLTLSYRSVFCFKHQYGVIVGILLYIGSVCYICKECKHCQACSPFCGFEVNSLLTITHQYWYNFLMNGKKKKLTFLMLPHYLTMLTIMNGQVHLKYTKNIIKGLLMKFSHRNFLQRDVCETLMTPNNWSIKPKTLLDLDILM